MTTTVDIQTTLATTITSELTHGTVIRIVGDGQFLTVSEASAGVGTPPLMSCSYAEVPALLRAIEAVSGQTPTSDQ